MPHDDHHPAAPGARARGAHDDRDALTVPIDGPVRDRDDRPIPGRIGRYPVLGELGAGGMGVVYLARDPELGREIAIKTLPASFVRDPERVARFRQEARMLARVNHPSVTTIYSIETSGPEPFLTMEYVPGETLTSRIGGSPMETGAALVLARQIAAALEAAHARGVVHRDIKPANVRLTPEGAIKVLDFGLACVAEPLRSASAGAEAAGTPGYMSPEQLRGEMPEPHMDVWAFGCLLHALLTGRSPFAGATPRDTLAATLGSAPDLSALPDDAPAALREIVAACLAGRPADRPPSMRAVRREIDALLSREDGREETHHESDTPTNLRRRLTPLVGRERELEQLLALSSTHSLVTLTGPGGCGKTRLALEAARASLARAPGGVWFVELGALRDPALVADTVVAALALEGVPDRSPAQVIAQHLQRGKTLLVLDDCEHIIDAVAELCAELLDVCAELRIFATSREILAVDVERTFAVPPLGVPPELARGAPADRISESPSVRLFMERAREVSPSLALTEETAPVVAEICRRLDGLPLALELAAARVRVLSLGELARRLDRRFDLLTGVKRAQLPRHQTLRAMIDWSFELLDPHERTVLRRLSAFAGSWTMDGAEAVCAAEPIEPWQVLDLVTRLVEKSLVERVPGSEGDAAMRFRMLETVREYAREKLNDAGETASCLSACRRFLLQIVGDHRDEKAPPPGIAGRILAELPNLRAAFDPTGDVAGADLLAYAAEMAPFWRDGGRLREGLRACTAALDHPDNREPTRRRVEVLGWAGNLAWKHGDYVRARALDEEYLDACRRLGDRGGEARALGSLGLVAWSTGELERARELYERSLEIQREIGDARGEAASLNNLGLVAKYHKDYDAARRCYQASLELRLAAGEHRQAAVALNNLGVLATLQGNYAAARDHFARSGTLYGEMGNPLGEADCLANNGDTELLEGNLPRASALHRAALARRRDHEDTPGQTSSLHAAALVASMTGAHATAARLLAVAETTRERIGHALEPAVAEELDDECRKLRDALGGGRFDAEWAAGVATPLETAVEHALELFDAQDTGAGEATRTMGPDAPTA